jgi:PAT family beta-lactamase induction signal transducer AmpG
LKTGFTQTQIGDALGLAGLIATIVGGVFAGFVIIRLGVNKSLWIFAVFEGLSNVTYYALSLSGLNHGLMLLAVVTENFGVGLVSAGLLAYMMSLCNKRFSATQFALLSSLMGASRDIITAPSGKIAEMLGWPGFFLVTMAATIPVLALLPFLAPWRNEMPRGAATVDPDPAMAGAPVAASEFSE